MPKITSAISNFTAGEFSPNLLGRYDIARYANGAETLENQLILQAGGADARPGTKFVGHVKDSSKATRLIDFVFSTTQTYIIEMGDLYMRFYSNNGRVLDDGVTITDTSNADPCVVTAAGHGYTDGDWVQISEVVGMTELNGNIYVVANSGATFTLKDIDGNDIDSTGFTAYDSAGVVKRVTTITTPYTAAQLFDIQFAQTADIMNLVHESHAPRTLSRTAANVFAIAATVFRGGPFLDDNLTATTILPSADAGAAITLTASTAIFTADMVGSFIKVKSGYVKVISYSSTTLLDDCDVQVNEDGSAGSLATGPAATTDWALGAWSGEQGYPGATSFHEQRALYARTTKSPQAFDGSAIRDFTNFFPGTNDDDAYRYVIDTEQVNSIRWMSSGAKALQIGTFGGTFSASSGNSNESITPSNIVVQRDTTYGGANIPPKRIGNYIYYIQRSLTAMRELGFDFDIDSQQALDMTLLSDHILKATSHLEADGAVDMAYQQSPNNRLWIVRKDGQIATLTRQIDQEVTGWSRQVIAGSYNQTLSGTAQAKSVAIIPGLTGSDQVWVINKRTINSVTRQYVEFFMPEKLFTTENKDDAFFLDSGLTLDVPITISGATKADPIVISATAHGFSNGDQVKIVDVVGMTELNDNFYLVADKNPNDFELTDLDGNDIDSQAFTTYVTGGEVRKMVISISGLDHLEGESVSILADGAVRPNLTVASGAITLPLKAAKVHIGLGYNSDIGGLPLADGSATGIGRGKDRKTYIMTIIFAGSLGAQFGHDEDNLDTIFFRAPNDINDQSPPLVTGTLRMNLPLNWGTDGKWFLRQSQPLPMRILGVILQSEVVDK